MEASIFSVWASTEKYVMAYRKSHLGHLFDNLDFSKRIYQFSVNFSFGRSYFLFGFPLKNMTAYRKSHLGHLFGNLDFSEEDSMLRILGPN